MNWTIKRRAIAFLSLLLLGQTQLFGLSLGYECRCSGRVVQTTADHCHGPHGKQCLEPQAHDGALAHSFDHCSSSAKDAEQHVAVQEDADKLLPISLTVPAMPMLFPVEVPAWEMLLASPMAFVVARGVDLVVCRPPPSIGVARTVVLLI